MVYYNMPYLEGQGDLVSRLITPRTHIVTPFIPITNLLTKSPWSPKYCIQGAWSLWRSTGGPIPAMEVKAPQSKAQVGLGFRA